MSGSQKILREIGGERIGPSGGRAHVETLEIEFTSAAVIQGAITHCVSFGLVNLSLSDMRSPRWKVVFRLPLPRRGRVGALSRSPRKLRGSEPPGPACNVL